MMRDDIDYQQIMKKRLKGGTIFLAAATVAGAPVIAKAEIPDVVGTELVKSKKDSESDELYMDEGEQYEIGLVITDEASDGAFAFLEVLEPSSEQVGIVRTTLTFESVDDLDFNERVIIHNEAVNYYFSDVVAMYESGGISYEELVELFNSLEASYQDLLSENVELTLAEEQRMVDARALFESNEAERRLQEEEAFLQAEKDREEQLRQEYDKLKADATSAYEAAERQAQILHLVENGFLDSIYLTVEPSNEAFEEAWATFEEAMADPESWYESQWLKQYKETRREYWLGILSLEGFDIGDYDPLLDPDCSLFEQLLDEYNAELQIALDKFEEDYQKYWDDWTAYHDALIALAMWYVDQENLQAEADRKVWIEHLIQYGYLNENQEIDEATFRAAYEQWSRDHTAFHLFNWSDYYRRLEAFEHFISAFLPEGMTFAAANEEERQTAYEKAIQAASEGIYYGLNDHFVNDISHPAETLSVDGYQISYVWGSSTTVYSSNQMNGTASDATELLDLGIILKNNIGSKNPTIEITSRARPGFYEFYYRTTGNTVIYAVMYLTQEDVDYIQSIGSLQVEFSGGVGNNTQMITANPKAMFTPIENPGLPPKEAFVPEMIEVLPPKVPAEPIEPAEPNVYGELMGGGGEIIIPVSYVPSVFNFEPATFQFVSLGYQFEPGKFEFEKGVFIEPDRATLPDAHVLSDSTFNSDSMSYSDTIPIASSDAISNSVLDRVSDSKRIFEKARSHPMSENVERAENISWEVRAKEEEPKQLIMNYKAQLPSTSTKVGVRVKETKEHPYYSSLGWVLGSLLLIGRKKQKNSKKNEEKV